MALRIPPVVLVALGIILTVLVIASIPLAFYMSNSRQVASSIVDNKSIDEANESEVSLAPFHPKSLSTPPKPENSIDKEAKTFNDSNVYNVPCQDFNV